MKPVLRYIIFLLSLALSIMFFIFPDALTHTLGKGKMYLAILVIIGISFGFVYGIGYIPKSKFWRWLINPITILLLIFMPLVILKIYS